MCTFQALWVRIGGPKKLTLQTQAENTAEMLLRDNNGTNLDFCGFYKTFASFLLRSFGFFVI